MHDDDGRSEAGWRAMPARPGHGAAAAASSLALIPDAGPRRLLPGRDL